MDTLAQVGARSLAGLRRYGGDVDDVVGDLERGADGVTQALEALDVSCVGAGEGAAESSGCSDERTGLLPHDLEVMLDRILFLLDADRLAHLARDQLGEGFGDDPNGFGSERRYQA